MNSMICPYCGNLIAYNSYFDMFYCSKCGGFFKQATVMECNDLDKPLTNAQKIRAMSDEELATFISEIADECERNTECNQHCYGCDIEYCVRESCLKWLQQPAEEADHA